MEVERAAEAPEAEKAAQAVLAAAHSAAQCTWGTRPGVVWKPLAVWLLARGGLCPADLSLLGQSGRGLQVARWAVYGVAAD